MERAFFLLFASIAVASACGVVLLKNPVHSAVSLMACFIQIAALYILLHSPFLAAVQLFVYVGAIMVLFIFVIMMLEIRQATLERFLPGSKYIALVFSVVLGSAMLWLLFSSPLLSQIPPPAPSATQGSVSELGQALFAQYLLPFEVVSIVLLVALVGAIFMTHKGDG
jgi:NADH-quinone oxidoreductase subunit J